MLESIWYRNFTWSGQNLQKIVKSVPVLGAEPNWNKIHNVFWIRSISGKIMVSNVFLHGNGVVRGILAFWDFWVMLVPKTHSIYVRVRTVIISLNSNEMFHFFKSIFLQMTLLLKRCRFVDSCKNFICFIIHTAAIAENNLGVTILHCNLR